MAKVINHGNRRKEKGLTLIEVVIALSIIVTVSIAAMTIVVYSSSSLHSTAEKGFFQHEVDTLSDLYLSYTGTDYANAMKQYTGKTDVADGDDYTLYYDTAFRIGDSASYSYLVTLDFQTEPTKLVVTASKKEGAAILSREVAR